MLKSSERIVESVLFGSRWLLAPFFLGLIVATGLLLFKFGKVLFGLIAHAATLGSNDIVVGVLNLIDVTLMANLLIIVILAGYESSVSRLDEAAHDERLGWMGQVGFSDLKLKVLGSIIAISAVELLRIFLTLGTADLVLLKWRLLIYLAIVVSGLLFAAMERLGHRAEH